jgi:hypothetical protein
MNELLGKTIFWRKDQVEIINRLTNPGDFNQSSMLKYLYCPCAWISVDRGVLYGFYDQSERFAISWDPREKEQLPEEFQLALLIMGVS